MFLGYNAITSFQGTLLRSCRFDKGIALRKLLPRSLHLAEGLFPSGIFALLLAFTYAFFFKVPYSGFDFNPSNGEIIAIYVVANPAAALRTGDMVVEIGPVSRTRYAADARQVFFEDTKRGDVVDIVVERGGRRVTVPWIFPGFNQPEFISRLFNNWWLAFIFWSFGLASQLFLRPKDSRWRLLIAANYLTSIWLIAGNLSAWQIWGSSVLFHAVTWLAVPVYLNLHWDFPKPLGRMPVLIWCILYLVAVLLAVGQLGQFLPRNFYLFGFLLMLAGSITLLAVHFARQPEQRREVGLLVVAILIAMAPSISLGIVKSFGNFPPVGSLALLALPIVPGAYFFAVYRRQLGGLELRANRITILFIYGAVLLTISIPMAFMINSWSRDAGTAIAIGLLFTLLVSLSSAVIYPYFQRWVEHRALGMPLPPARVLELYTAHIVTSMETEQLRRVICDEVLPSLLIRQIALLRLDDVQNPIPVCKLGVTEMQLPSSAEIPALLAESGRVRSPLSDREDDRPCPWVRLILKLSLAGKPVGLCLLGRRDPDDFYAATEIPTLQALMDQTALALMNIEQAEHLHALYMADIERHEAERNHLALELHDDVLGQMALLAMSAGDNVASAQFNQAYQSATEHIRQIVNGLRPAMLSYGLQPALDELADDIGAIGSGIIVRMELPPNEIRYPPMTELHLFRIIQQACQNALQHARAKTICITGNLEPERIELTVEDDGIGFATGEGLDLPGLLTNKHFGLAGMYERAALIGAVATIETNQNGGTRVRVIWRSKEPPV